MKKFFKILWKSLLVVVALSVAFICVSLACVWYGEYKSFRVNRTLSQNVMVRYYYKQDECKIYNKELGKITLKGVLHVVANEGDSLAVFFKDGLRGYLDAYTGYEVIPAQYKHAWVFSEGMAAVVNQAGKIGFINKDNEVVIPFKFVYHQKLPITYYFSNGYCVMTNERGACGMIDKKGNWVMEPKYDCIGNQQFGKYRIVEEDEKYGMIDEDLNIVFPIVYDKIEFAEHELDGALLTKNHVKQHVTFDGTVINPFVVDGVEDMHYKQHMETEVICGEDGNIEIVNEEDVLSDYMRFRVNDLYGVMRRATGKVILSAEYEAVYMASPTLLGAQLEGTDSYVLYDMQGRRVDCEIK